MTDMPTNWTNTNPDYNYSGIDEGHNDRKPDISQQAIDYLTKMASRRLYNQRKVTIRVYPLGKRKYVLPRKVM